MGTAHLTIGQLAQRSGLAHSALRYYEELGLIRAERTPGNQRRFEPATLRRLGFVRAAQEVGLSLDEIADALASLPGGRTPTPSDWASLSATWRPRLNQQIDRLERLRDRLDGCIGCGCLSLTSCRLHNPEDAAAARGTGAVHLQPGDPGSSH